MKKKKKSKKHKMNANRLKLTFIVPNFHKIESILRSNTASQITPFSRECFFMPLWKTIKNSDRTGSGREDRLEKTIAK